MAQRLMYIYAAHYRANRLLAGTALWANAPNLTRSSNRLKAHLSHRAYIGALQPLPIAKFPEGAKLWRQPRSRLRAVLYRCVPKKLVRRQGEKRLSDSRRVGSAGDMGRRCRGRWIGRSAQRR